MRLTNPFLHCAVAALALSGIASAFAEDAAPPPVAASTGFHNESGVGIVLVSGNAETATYNLSQQSAYGWGMNLAKLTGKYLKSSANGVETSRYWTLGARFDRDFNVRSGVFVGYSVESDLFAGYNPRHNADVGFRYHFVKTDEVSWLGELGYRYTLEHQTALDTNVPSHNGRAYTEVERTWTKSSSAKFWVEYLPNFTTQNNFRVNAEASATAAFTHVLSVKVGYLVKYNNVPPLPGGQKADRFFTTALIAKF